MAHYLVTGGAGFIGSHLVQRLLTDGHRVRVLDDFSSGRRANIDAVRSAGPDRLQVSSGDIREAAVVQAAMKDLDGVFHLAAKGSVPRSVSHPQETHAVNATGLLNVLVAARDAEVRRFVFSGSSAVYGALETNPKREDHPTVPLSPYGLTKLIGENYLSLFRELYGMETVTMRFYNVFGPRQDPASQYAAVVPSFISRLLKDEAPVVYGDGEQSRDFAYVEDVVAATVTAMEASPEAVAPGLFNVASGSTQTVNELLETLRAAMNKTVEARYEAERAGDIRHSEADISRIQKHLGFRPGVTFAEGLTRTIRHFEASAPDA